MLNYNKTHDLKAVSTFFKEHNCDTVDVEPVIDGADVQLIYNQGKLISVITFGDGKHGIECLDNARYIDDIPKKLFIISEVIAVVAPTDATEVVFDIAFSTIISTELKRFWIRFISMMGKLNKIIALNRFPCKTSTVFIFAITVLLSALSRQL